MVMSVGAWRRGQRGAQGARRSDERAPTVWLAALEGGTTPGRDSVVWPNGGSDPPHQVGCAGWWRESSVRLFCQRGGALESLVGPCGL